MGNLLGANVINSACSSKKLPSMFKTFYFLTLLCSFYLVNFAFAVPSASKESISVGVVIPLTGPFADWAFGIKGGLELAAQDSHSAVKLVFEDDRCENQHAMAAVQKLLSTDHVKLFIGPCSPGAFEAVNGVQEAKQALYFSMSLLDDDIFKRYSNLINFSTQISVEAIALSHYVASLGQSQVAIVHGATRFGEEFGKQFIDSLKKVKIETLSEEVPLDATDFRPIILRFLSRKIDVIAIEHGERTAGLLVRQARALGYKGRFVGYYGLESPSFLEAAGVAAEGMRYTFPKIPSSKDKSEFEERFKEKYNREPNASAFFAYDGLTIIASAIKGCGGDNVDCIRKYYSGLRYQGLSGAMTFGADGKLQREFGIKEIRNSKFIWTDPDSPSRD